MKIELTEQEIEIIRDALTYHSDAEVSAEELIVIEDIEYRFQLLARGESDETLLTKKQAAEYLGLSPYTLSTWTQPSCQGPRHDLPYRVINNRAMYKRGDLDKLMNSAEWEKIRPRSRKR